MRLPVILAVEEVGQLHQTMRKLLPQIRYWIRTGFVAENKIVSLGWVDCRGSGEGRRASGRAARSGVSGSANRGK